jgi:ribosomal protein L37AE/L43A
MDECPKCDQKTVIFNANTGILKCSNCGFTFGGKHVQTDEELEEELKFLDEYIALC